ncbi:MAG: InlB B-repeat-containing protein [Prevotellaceae bacterium]|nr:InlB B-repeat-containing protein [Prevotellaceae bacterium]
MANILLIGGADEKFFNSFSLKRITYPTGGFTEYELNRAVGNTKGNGQRIKNIKSYPSSGTDPIVTIFSYGKNESGQGITYNTMSNEWFIRMIQSYRVDNPPCPGGSHLQRVNFRDIKWVTTLFTTPINFSNESFTVYYPEICTYKYNKDGSLYNGKTISHYNIPNIITKTHHYPGLKPTLNSRIAYNSLDMPVQKETYAYQRILGQKYISAQPIQDITISGTSDRPQDNTPAKQWLYTYHHVPQVYIPFQHDIYSSVDLLTEKHEVSYSGIDSIIQTENYSYNSRNQPYKMTATDSKGGSVEKESQYHADQNQQARERNLYGLISQEITRNSGQEIKRVRYSYPPLSADIPPLPTSAGYSEAGSAGLSREAEYLYDNTNGNLLQYVGRGGIPVSYQWRHRNTYPIIQAVGATYDKLMQTVAGTANWGDIQYVQTPDQLAVYLAYLRSQLPAARLTGYTYQPLAGVTSETASDGLTTYYQYDSFGRLYKILDHQNNIISQHDYHYAGTTAPPTAASYSVFIASLPFSGGSVTGRGTYAPGARATVTATPNDDHIFEGWYESGTKVSDDMQHSFYVQRDYILTARFSQKAYYTVAVTGTPAEGGSATGGGTYLKGTTVAVTAAHSVGHYVFDGWYSGYAKVSSSASYTFTLASNRTLEARFIVTPQHTITALVSPGAGGVVTGGGTHTGGTNVTLTATANSGHTFAGWKEGDTWLTDYSGSSLSFAVSGNRTLTAAFAVGTLGKNVIRIDYENGKQYPRAAYPVASLVTVQVKDGDGGRGEVALHPGEVELRISEDDWFWDIRSISPSSDGVYYYTLY